MGFLYSHKRDDTQLYFSAFDHHLILRAPQFLKITDAVMLLPAATTDYVQSRQHSFSLFNLNRS